MSGFLWHCDHCGTEHESEPVWLDYFDNWFCNEKCLNEAHQARAEREQARAEAIMEDR